MHALSTYLSKGLSALGFNPCCLLCQQAVHQYQRCCAACMNRLPFLGPSCELCARELPLGQAQCGQCQQLAPPWDRLWVALDYAFPVDQLVLGGKFSQKLQNLTLLAELFISYWAAHLGTLPDVLVPVPLHPQRLRERGYNQALELARVLGKKWQIPVDYTAAHRLQATLAQTALSAEERRANVKQAFKVSADFRDARLAIVDDVFTTGSTVGAMSVALRSAGAKQIDIYCMARKNLRLTS